MEEKKYITHRIVSKSKQLLVDLRAKDIKAAGIELAVGDSVEVTIQKIAPKKPQESATGEMQPQDDPNEGAI